MTMLNLDQKAAKYAQDMVNRAKGANEVSMPVETLERLVTKTLGVLQEQGVYAMLLFLYSRTSDENKIAPSIRNPLFLLLRDDDQNHYVPGFNGKKVPNGNTSTQEALEFFSEHVLSDLDTTLLIRELYEQTLIYARYGAKAEG